MQPGTPIGSPNRHGLPREVIDRYERAQAEGGRASLALAWLFPIASRIGLVTTAILLGVILLGLIACVVLLLAALGS